jgi:hypothetical protein
MVNAVHSYAQDYAADVVATFTEQQNPTDARNCQIALFVQNFALFAFQEAFTVMSWATNALSGLDFGKLTDNIWKALGGGGKELAAFLAEIKVPMEVVTELGSKGKFVVFPESIGKYVSLPMSGGKSSLFLIGSNGRPIVPPKSGAAKWKSIHDDNFMPGAYSKGRGTPLWMNIISPMADTASHAVDFTRMTYNLEMAKVSGNEAQKFDAAQDDNPNSGRLRMQNTPIFQNGICAHFGGNKKEENAARTSSMNVWLGKMFLALHGQASTFSDWLLNSKGDDMDEYDG